MTSARTALREALNAKLLPELTARGFTGPRAITGNSLLHDFKRPCGESSHVITLQLEKRGLPRFIVNLAIEPSIGFDALMNKGATVLSGVVRPKPGVTTWFRADPTLWQRLLGHRDDKSTEAVASCLALLSEIDAWWETQASSEHIAVYLTHFPGVANVGRA